MAPSEQTRSRVHVCRLPDDDGDSEELRALLSALRERFGDRLTVDSGGDPLAMEAEPGWQRRLEDCAVLLAVISPRWLTVLGAHAEEPDSKSPAIQVRRCLTIALSEERIEIIPVLVGVAALRPEDLPGDLQPLAPLPAIEYHAMSHGSDAERLIQQIESALRRSEARARFHRERDRAVQSALERARALLERGQIEDAVSLILEADHPEARALRAEADHALRAQAERESRRDLSAERERSLHEERLEQERLQREREAAEQRRQEERNRLEELRLREERQRQEELRRQERRLGEEEHRRLGEARLREEVRLQEERSREKAPRAGGRPPTEKPSLVDDNVQFTVYRRSVVQPARWYPLLVFAHLTEKRPDAPPEEGDPLLEVQAQARRVLGESADEFQIVTSDSRAPVMREGELRVVPDVEGVEFNPPERRFIWSESVHREEFRMRAAESLQGQTARGVVTIYSGNLLLADVPLSIKVDKGSQKAVSERSQARPYRRVFASYSHGDVSVVEEFEAHARATGDRYLRDVVSLRAGEVWNDRLLEMIRTADVFQLFWSWNAMGSKLVSAEWQFALTLNRPHFVRPVYWEEPLPQRAEMPPEALRQLHFQRVYPRVAAAALPGWGGTVIEPPVGPEPARPDGVVVQTRPASRIKTRETVNPPARYAPKRRVSLTATLRMAAMAAPLLAVALYIAATYQGSQSPPAPSPPDRVEPPSPPADGGTKVTPPVSVPTPAPAQPAARDREPPAPNSPMAAGVVSIEEISLRGLVHSGDKYFAVVEGPGGKMITLREGDRLIDGVVKSINADGIVLLQVVNDPQSPQRQREVIKRLPRQQNVP